MRKAQGKVKGILIEGSDGHEYLLGFESADLVRLRSEHDEYPSSPGQWRCRAGRMSQWADPDRWARLRSGEVCVICRQGAPDDILVELETSWVTVNEDALMRGYACLVFRRHVVELHDLSEAEGTVPGRPFRGWAQRHEGGQDTGLRAWRAVVRTRLRETLVGAADHEAWC